MTDASYASDTFDAESSLTKSGRRFVQYKPFKNLLVSKVYFFCRSELRDVKELSSRSLVTASDSSMRRDHTSSIHTESGVPAGAVTPPSKTDSISEDIPSEKGLWYLFCTLTP
jgi:hypothetical protein